MSRYASLVVFCCLLIPTVSIAQDGDLSEAYTAYERRDYKHAAIKLEREAARGNPDANEMLAYVHYFYGRYDQARACLAKATATEPLAELLLRTIDNPFASKLGERASQSEGFSKKRTYYVVTDLGMSKPEESSGKKKKKPKRGKKSAGHKELAELMEMVSSAYSRRFPMKRDRELVSRVIVFSDRDEFEAWCRKLDPEDDPSSTEAFYDPNTHTLVVGTGATASEDGRLISREMEGTIIHEAFHQYVDFFVPDCPYWFNEGMAEYFGCAQVDRKKKKIPLGAVAEDRLVVIQEAIKTGSYVPLPRLLQMSGDAFMVQADLLYPQSWSLCHFLIHGHPKGKKAIQAYFKCLVDGKDGQTSFAEVFKNADLTELETQWKEYVKTLKVSQKQL